MSQCDTCAFGKVGGAAAEPMNKLKGEICALGGIPFWCHHAKDGSEYDWAGGGNPMLLPIAQRKICDGWRADVAKLKRRGWFTGDGFMAIRRAVAQRALVMLDRFTRKDLSLHHKQKARKALERCVRFLAAKDISNREIPL